MKNLSEPIKTEWVTNRPRVMKIIAYSSYHDHAGNKWEIYPGDLVDGASIPRMLWIFEGSPFVGLYREASAFHDVACQKKNRPYEVVHQMFSDAMLDNRYEGVGQKKKAWAVKHFGPRW